VTTTAEIITTIRGLKPGELPGLLIAIAAVIAEQKPAPSREPAAGADEPLLTVPQAAALLNYRPSFVYEMVRRGDLAAVKDRKFVRIRQSAVNEYIARHEQRGTLPLLVSQMLTSAHDRKFPEAQTQGARTHSSRAGRQTRPPSNNRGEMGNGPETDT
jgi:excisionase family DNA binding protein